MASIEQYYENYWEDPNQYCDPTTPQREALLRKVLPTIPKGGKVLDVGCGRGEFCDLFAREGFSADGIDISKSAIEYAQKRYPGPRFRAVLVEDLLPAEAGTYDLAFSSEVIEHLFDVGAYLLAINHVLKPGGTLVLTTPYHGLAKNIMVDLLNYAGHYDPMGQHIRFFDTKGLRRCVESFGFTPKHWWGYGRPWPFWKSFFLVATKTSEAKPLAVGTQGKHC